MKCIQCFLCLNISQKPYLNTCKWKKCACIYILQRQKWETNLKFFIIYFFFKFMIDILPSMFLQEYDYILDYILSEKKLSIKKLN